MLYEIALYISYDGVDDAMQEEPFTLFIKAKGTIRRQRPVLLWLQLAGRPWKSLSCIAHHHVWSFLCNKFYTVKRKDGVETT